MQLSRDLLRGLFLCLAGAAVALTSVACTALGAQGMEPGDRVGAVTERVTAPGVAASNSWVQLPEGKVEFVVTEPLREVPARDTLGSQDLSPASGATIVGVHWKVVPGGVSTQQAALSGAREAPGGITLLAGDQRIALTDEQAEGEQWRRRGALFVAVPEDAELTIEVDYDGVTQRVDVRTGRREVSAAAQPLYDEPGDTPAGQSCTRDPGTDPGWTANIWCRAATTTVSYAPDVGWAPEHEPWQVVRLDLTLDSAMRKGDRYAATESSGTALLDGTEPSLVVPRETGSGPGSSSEYLVFPGSPGPHTLTVTRTWSLTRESGPATAPDQRDLELTSSVEID